MRSLFLQMFLAFWAVTVTIFVAATLFAPRFDPGTPQQLRAALSASVESLGKPALAHFLQQGCAGLNSLPPQMRIADANGDPLCGPAFDPSVQAMEKEAGASNRALFLAQGNSLINVIPLMGADGKKYVIVQHLSSVSRSWWPHYPPREALLISVFATLLLAYFLTRPLRALSEALRRFSEGDMDVRLPTKPWWMDFGGGDIRDLMADFNHMAVRIRELVDAQKLLVRDVSHELRSPLARLQVALGIAREEAPGSTEMLDQASSEADRLNALIGELLTLALMESVPQQAAAEIFSLEEIFDLLLPDMKFEAEAHGARIVYQSFGTPFVLRGRSEMLRRAFENIIRNAIRYTPDQEYVSITVSMPQPAAHRENLTPGGDRVCEVLIEDRGPGVPVDSLQDIFRPFYRVDMAREGTSGGFGVGLAIAERAILQHRGRISVENRIDGGLSVRISIPEASA